jgi:LPS-assembly protein
LLLNSAAYRTDLPMSDGRLRAQRTIPTVSIDSGLRLERPVSWFGSESLQTLEPRLHYVRTPRIDQTHLPLFDTAASDFNELSIYADNEFTGVDQVNDAHQVTLGATSRVIGSTTGLERVRFGAAERFQFRDQQLTSDGRTGSTRASDLLLFASGGVTHDWRMDTTVQYSPDLGRTVRSILSARYQPGPFQTISGTYRYARDLSEQFELGFQWPLLRGKGPAATDGSCKGTLYGVGRVNYSVKDDRITDSIFGLEYDAGCWITRVVYERISTGQSEATRRLMLQLELVGLSRLGSNPLQVLKDNIPGYRLLRDTNAAPLSTVDP